MHEATNTGSTIHTVIYPSTVCLLKMYAHTCGRIYTHEATNTGSIIHTVMYMHVLLVCARNIHIRAEGPTYGIHTTLRVRICTLRVMCSHTAATEISQNLHMDCGPDVVSFNTQKSCFFSSIHSNACVICVYIQFGIT